MKSIKEVVKSALWKKKMSLGQLSEAVGITQQSLSKIFDKNSTTNQMLEKIALALEIDAGEFFETSNKVEEPQPGYTVIKNEELIELQQLALGNMKRELEHTKNIKVLSK